MIVFYTKVQVQHTFDKKTMFDLIFECVSGMRNVPELFKNQTWDGNISGEWKSERNSMDFEIDEEFGITAFRVAIVDLTEELWTTDIVLNEIENVIQFRLSREKKFVSRDFDHKFNIPYVFKKIIRDGYGGEDNGLSVSEKPIYISENNINIIADIINKKSKYYLPIVYVSHPFLKEEYEVNVDELAKDLAGSAHVLVEKELLIPSLLRNLTEDKNPYNGAIDVFYDDDSFRYFPGESFNPNYLRYKISHAIYARMAMRNIDEKSSLSSLRIRNKIKKLQDTNKEKMLQQYEIERLNAKWQSDNEVFEMASEELKQQDRRINELEKDKHELEKKVNDLKTLLSKKNTSESKSICFDYSEEQYYEDEIKRMVLESIKLTISQYGEEEQTRRDYHILKDLVDNNIFSHEGDEIKKELFSILKKRQISKGEINALKGLGFVLQKGAHDKYVFHEDDRYILTVSNTPSDYREAENMAHKAINLIFGRT